MDVDPDAFDRLLSQTSFASNGDGNEQKYARYLSETFPNCERFWQVFVVPLTGRIEGGPEKLIPNIRFRQSVKPALEDIASAHYSMFMHLAYAHVHLEREAVPSFLEAIYVHLASACDLAETVLGKW